MTAFTKATFAFASSVVLATTESARSTTAKVAFMSVKPVSAADFGPTSATTTSTMIAPVIDFGLASNVKLGLRL